MEFILAHKKPLAITDAQHDPQLVSVHDLLIPAQCDIPSNRAYPDWR
jgi:hypothetical protein